MDPNNPNPTPDDGMEDFARAAVKGHLPLKSFMEREGSNYGSKTTLWKHVRLSEDKNWQLHTLVLEFRTGAVGVKSTLWQCYEGEGSYSDEHAYPGAFVAYGLDEAFDIGMALFPQPGPTEDNVYNLWTYINESEKIFNSPGDFAIKMRALGQAFEARIGRPAMAHEIGGQIESLPQRLVRVLLEGDEDEFMKEMATVAAGGAERLALALRRNEDYKEIIKAPADNTFELELEAHKISFQSNKRQVTIKWTHHRYLSSEYNRKRGGGFTWFDINDLDRFVPLVNGVIEAAKRPYPDDELVRRAYENLLTISKPTKSGSKYGASAWYFSSGQDMEFLKFGKRRRLR